MHEVMQQLLTKAEHEKATVYLQVRREVLTKTNHQTRRMHASLEGAVHDT